MADDCKGFAKNILKDEDISHCENNSKLTKFFTELTENRINYQIPREEANDSKTYINTLVQTLVALVTTKVGWLPFSRLLQVGSMAEETSIQAPDEFDCLVVKHVEDGGIEVERVCEERRGYIHVKVADPNLSLLWGKWLKGKYLKCDFTRAETDVLGHGYFDTLGNAFMIEVKAAIKEHYQELICRAKTGTMEIDSNYMTEHGPAFMQTFIWKPSSRKKKSAINVDITPAKEINLSPEVITTENVFDSLFFTKLQDNGKYIIISCHNNATCDARQCLCLTFTETEAELKIEIMLQSVEDISRQCSPGVDSLKIVNRHVACFKGYAMSIPIPKSIPFFKENKELTRCLECYQHYFNEDIL